MASNTNTAVGSSAGLDIDWDAVVIIIKCDRCGGQFDAIADVDGDICGVCQELFGGNKPADVATAAGTTMVARNPRLQAGQIACSRCDRPFRSTDKNNGVSCTWCCNDVAGEGYDVFAWYGKEMSPQARETLRQYHQRLAMPAVAPITFLRGSTSSTAPTFGAQPTTSAAAPRKRAVEESENEQISQQNEPAAKRSKTSQQQETTTMQSTQPAQLFETPEQTTQTAVDDAELVNNPEQASQPYRSDEELANILSAAIKEMDEQGKQTTK
ncbi:hypothetical protein Q7P35_011290 [Cladosporium inversicolor]